MLRLLSRSNPENPVEYQPAVSDAQRLYARDSSARSIYSHLPPTTRTRTHAYTAARKPKSLLFVFYNLRSRDPDVEDAHYGYTGHDSAPQAEEMSRSASGLLGFICTNSKLRLPLRFSDKKSERRDRNRGRRYLQQDYREEK